VEASERLASEPEHWYDVRFETRPRRPEPSPYDRALVDRVLRDLG
jgi:hypothetical protein